MKVCKLVSQLFINNKYNNNNYCYFVVLLYNYIAYKKDIQLIIMSYIFIKMIHILERNYNFVKTIPS